MHAADTLHPRAAGRAALRRERAPIGPILSTAPPHAAIVGSVMRCNVPVPFVVAAALVLAPSARALAQWGPASIGRERVERFVARDVELALWTDMGFYGGTTSAGTGVARIQTQLFSWTPTVGVLGRFADLVGAELVLPMMFGEIDPEILADRDSDFRVGNPWLAVYWAPAARLGDVSLLGRAGLGVALPGNQASSDLAEGANWIMAIGSRGAWNAFWYVDEHWSIVMPAGIEAWLGPNRIGYAAAELAFAYLVHNDADDTVAMQLALEGGVEPVEWMRLTLRIAGVGEIDDATDRDDDFQLSIEPRVTLGSGPVYGQIGFLVNVDEPYGVGNDASDFMPGIWCLRLLLGGRV